MISAQDTIFAPATTPGTGAISIIRLSGPSAFEICDNIVALQHGTISASKGYSIHFGKVTSPDGSLLDEVLVSVFRAPHSYTGEDSVEISCHASTYIVSEIMSLLSTAGARMASPGEFTQRAFINGKMDLSQAEAVADVIAANSQASLRVALNQLKGAYSSELRELRDRLVELAALMELELDFSEEDVEFADRSRLRELLALTRNHIEKLVESFRLGNAIRNGVPVAIVGAVNAGKSTLLNALVGHDRAIVSDTPGTTRDTVEELFTIGGLQLRFIDTAGLRDTEDTVEKIGIERSVKALSTAEIVIGVVSATASESEISAEIQSISNMVDISNQKLIIALNKMDLAKSVPSIPDICRISAANDCNISDKDVCVNYNEDREIGLREECNNVKCCRISAAKGEISELLDILEQHCRAISNMREDAILVTNIRHYEALQRAAIHLTAVSNGLTLGIPTDLIAEDLRSAISNLNSIFGDATIDAEVLMGQIFSRFCIGK